MKLYYFPPTRSERARWALEEVGAKYEAVLVNKFKGESSDPEYLAINPLGQLPALENNGKWIYESTAIALQAIETHPESGLAPEAGSCQRASYYQWAVFGPANIDPVLETITKNTLLLPEEKRRPELVEEAKADWARRAEVLAATLSKQDYLCGDSFSGADIIVGHCLFWADFLGLLEVAGPCRAYYDRLSKRPAFQRAYAESFETLRSLQA